MYIKRGHGFWSNLFMQFVHAYSQTQFSLRQCMGGCVRGLLEGTPLYGLYRYVWLQRVWFVSRFANK